MSARYLSANTLLECRLRTTDGGTAVLRDFVIDASAWTIAFLAAEVEGWVPDRHVLLLPGDVAGVDEARSEIELSLDAASLRASPTLAAGNDLASLDADMAPPAGWESQWAAETDPESTAEAPATAPDPVEPRAMDLGDSAELIRADTLRGYGVETADGVEVRMLDLLIDDADWSLAYLELAVGPNGKGRTADRVRTATRCLVPRRSIDWLNRGGETLHIAVWAEELRNAELIPHPAAPDHGAQVRMLKG
jgi:hypothetical protein